MRRFSIRDLFWLTLVVAMGLAWYVDSRRVAWTTDARWRWESLHLARQMRDAGWTVDPYRDTPPFADPPPAVP